MTGRTVKLLTSDRYVLAPAPHHCTECARKRLGDMDDFQLRSPADRRRSVSAAATNPFLSIFVDAFVPDLTTVDERYTAIGVHDLRVHHGEVVDAAHCPHARASVVVPRERGDGYRPYPLAGYFATAPEAPELCNPVTGVLSAHATDDVASLVTAKVSGFTMSHGEHGPYVRAWGGHCESYARSRWVGLVEGIERICCAEPSPADLWGAVPEGVREIGLDEFGVDAASWRIPHPVVGTWTLGRDLVTGDPVALPTRTVFYEAPIADPVYVQDSSSGCAAGGSDAEATLFGLLEVVERDAFLLAWYGDLPLREIRTDSIRDEESRHYLRRLRLVGRTVRFLDATVGVGIPTVVAVCDTASGGVCLGAGSHPDPERALKSALVEVASDFQVIETRVHQRRDELEDMLRDPAGVRGVEDHADLYGLPGAREWLTTWAHTPTPVSTQVALAELRRDAAAGAGVETDLDLVVEAIAAAGFSPLVVDVGSSLSRRYGFSCVKAVVPGLLPIDFGWSNQRALRMPRLREQSERWLRQHGGAVETFLPHQRPHPFP